MNEHAMQKAGEKPRRIEPGMQLVLGELGVVVTVTRVDGEIVQTIGAGVQEASIFSIGEDGTMEVERALECELACDWDPAWARADYYACDDDPDELDGITPEAALCDYFHRTSKDRDRCKWSHRVCPLEVTAYKREVVSDAWLTNMAAELVELCEDNYALEYSAHPFRRPFDDNRREFRPALIAKFRAVLAEAVDCVQPYNCTAVASRLFAASDVERILRSEAPDWFEESAAAPDHKTATENSLSL